MQNYFTKLILGFKDNNIQINNYSMFDGLITIKVSLKLAEQTCPSCGNKTSNVHDYKTRKFKHGNSNGYHILIYYNRRRYLCRSCNKRFPEPNTFIDRYAKISNQLNHLIINNLKDKLTFKQIAKDNNVSSSTVIRRFDKHFSINKLSLPEVISFDEFKKSNKNSKRGKYALAIADPINKKIIDIIPNRRKYQFDNYLETISFDEKKRVNTVIIDMWDPYRDLTYKHFPNALLVIDRFHYIRNIIWWFNDIRIKTMNSFKTNTKGYKLLKRYNKLLTKNPNDINSIFSYDVYSKKLVSEQSIINECLELSEELKEAYMIYKYFQNETKIPHDSIEESVSFINQFVQKLFESKLIGSVDLAKTFINWKKEIANSLYLTYENDKGKTRYSNGFIEGVNNYIKTFRRMSYNFRDFNRFITRIITTFNNDYMIKA